MRSVGLLLFLLFALSFLGTTAAANEVFEQSVSKAEWPEFDHGANLASLPQLQQILGRFDERPGTRIEIRYPGGGGGEPWARQVQQWFIAYGVPLAFVDLAPGSGVADLLLIILIQRD